MARAIIVSLLVIVTLISGVSPIHNINQVYDNCCNYDSSYIIDNLNQDYIGINKINDYTLTSIYGTYFIQSTFTVRETSAVAFRLLIADGFVDIRVNDVNYRVVTAGTTDNIVIISRSEDIFTLTVGSYSTEFYVEDDIVRLTFNYSLTAFKLTNLADKSIEKVNLEHGKKYYNTIAGAVGLIGIGVLKGNDYAVESFNCGEFFSILLLQNFDLLFFDFFITLTQQFNITTEENIPLPNFCYALNIEILSAPLGGKVFIDESIKFSEYGKYHFRLINKYEVYTYFVDYVRTDIPPPNPPEEVEPPLDPPEEVEPTPDPPDEVEPPPETPDEIPPPILPDADYQPPNDEIYTKTVNWVKVGSIIGIFIGVLVLLISAILILSKKKKPS